MVIDYLARNGVLELDDVAFFLLQFWVVSLGLYLAFQSIAQMPYLKRGLLQQWAQLILTLIVTLVAIFITFWISDLRIMKAMGYEDPESSIWLWFDVLLSGLALSRVSSVWHFLFRWLDRITS